MSQFCLGIFQHGKKKRSFKTLNPSAEEILRGGYFPLQEIKMNQDVKRPLYLLSGGEKEFRS